MSCNVKLNSFRPILGILLFFFLLGCREKEKTQVEPTSEKSVLVKRDTLPAEPKKDPLPPLESLQDTTFVRLADYSPDFTYDMRYATDDNFLKTKVYECAECYTRKKTAEALIAANREFMENGFRIRFFDCYRPNSVQYKMWEIYPNPQYVANPVKGSIHNRGGAVDITLETLEGEVLDMGTDFDFFGREAHHDNLDLPREILDNRALLKGVMEKYGFWSVRTEWWHYNLGKASRDPVANFTWNCSPL